LLISEFLEIFGPLISISRGGQMPVSPPADAHAYGIAKAEE